MRAEILVGVGVKGWWWWGTNDRNGIWIGGVVMMGNGGWGWMMLGDVDVVVELKKLWW